MLVAGGIGFTPMASLAGYIATYKAMGRFARLSKLRVVWIAKYRSELAVFDGVLGRVYALGGAEQATGITVVLDLFATRENEGEEVGGADGVAIEEGASGSASSTLASVEDAPSTWATAGRPNLPQLLADAVREKTPAKTALLTCGPSGMVDTCRDVALALGVDFHAESFFM